MNCEFTELHQISEFSEFSKINDCSEMDKINACSDMDRIDACTKMNKNDVTSRIDEIDTCFETVKIDVCSGCRNPSSFLQVLPCKHTICQDCVFNSVHFRLAGEDGNCTVCGLYSSTTDLPASSPPRTHETERVEQKDSPTIDYYSVVSYLSEVQFAHPGYNFSSRSITKSVPIPTNKRHRTSHSVFGSCATDVRDSRMKDKNATDEPVVERRSQDGMFAKERRLLEHFRGETEEMDDRYHFKPIQRSESDDDDDDDDDDVDCFDDGGSATTATDFGEDAITPGTSLRLESPHICV